MIAAVIVATIVGTIGGLMLIGTLVALTGAIKLQQEALRSVAQTELALVRELRELGGILKSPLQVHFQDRGPIDRPAVGGTH